MDTNGQTRGNAGRRGTRDDQPPLARGLAGYVAAVAVALGVPEEGTGYEISDTVTAYLGLSQRWSERPDRDLMAVWSERHGWVLAVETDPADGPEVVAYLGGAELAPAPTEVAGFVADVLAGRSPGAQTRPTFASPSSRDELGGWLARYASTE